MRPGEVATGQASQSHDVARAGQREGLGAFWSSGVRPSIIATDARRAFTSKSTIVPGTQLKSAFPARGPEPTWALTCLDRAAVIERVFAAPFRLATPRSQRQRESSVLAVLGLL